jgi:hypothetical protein
MNTYKTNLVINPDKLRAEHPHLVGSIEIEGVKYRIALWLQQTKDKTKDYYSGSLQLADDRESPRAKTTLYQYRKETDADPDYHSTEDRRVDLDGRLLYSYLWIRVAPKDSPDELEFHIEFSEQPRRQALSQDARKFRESVMSQFNSIPPRGNPKEGKTKQAKQTSYDENGDPDDITF